MFRFFLIGIILFIAFFLVRKFIRQDTNQSPKIESDTMVECDICGTYVSEREMISTKGKHYCSQECLRSGK